MPISAGTPVTNKNSSGGTSTFSYTVTKANAYLVVYVYGPTSDLVTSVVWGVTTLTKKGGIKPAGFGRYLYLYGAAVVAGTNNVVVTATGSDLLICIAEEYGGVLSASTSVETDGSSSTSFSTTRTTVDDNSWYLAVTTNAADGDSVSAGSGTTLRSNLAGTDPGNALFDSGGAVHPAGSKTLNMSKSGSAVIWTALDLMLSPVVVADTGAAALLDMI